MNELRINDNIDSLTCSTIHDMVDEKFINNAIGGSVDGKGTAFQGEVAGLYAFDHFLDLDEAQSVLDAIKTDDNNAAIGEIQQISGSPAGSLGYIKSEKILSYNFDPPLRLKDEFTICSITRYKPGSEDTGAILQCRGEDSQWVHGHYNGHSGIVNYHHDDFLSSDAEMPYAVKDGEWVVTCGRNVDSPTAVSAIVNGLPAAYGGGGEGNCELMINPATQTDWQLAALYVWDMHLPDDVFMKVSERLNDYVARKVEWEFNCNLRGQYLFLDFHPDDQPHDAKRVHDIRVLGYDAHKLTNLTYEVLYGERYSDEHTDLIERHEGANVFVRRAQGPELECVSGTEVSRINITHCTKDGEYAKSTVILGVDDLLFTNKRSDWKYLGPMTMPDVTSAQTLTIVARVMLMRTCRQTRCTIFQFGQSAEDVFVALQIDSEQKLHLAGESVPCELSGSKTVCKEQGNASMRTLVWYDVIVQVQQNYFENNQSYTVQNHAMVQRLNSEDQQRVRTGISTTASLHGVPSARFKWNTINDHRSPLDMHVAGLYVLTHEFKNELLPNEPQGKFKDIFSHIRINATDADLTHYGLECAPCPSGLHSKISENNRDIQSCFKRCLAGQYAGTSPWTVIAQTYIPSYEPWVRHDPAWNPAHQFLTKDYTDLLASATHVKYECALGSEGSAINKIADFVQIYEIDRAKTACGGSQLYDCPVHGDPFYFAMDESPRFKLDIDKVVCMRGDDPSKQNNPGLGLWGRVSVIRVTGGAEDTLSTAGFSACQPCPAGKATRNENSNNVEECEASAERPSVDDKTHDIRFAVDEYERLMAIPVANLTTGAEFYQTAWDPNGQVQVFSAFERHYDRTYDYNRTYYDELARFGLDGLFPTLQSVEYKPEDVLRDRHVGFFRYRASSVLAVEDTWLLAFAHLERVSGEGLTEKSSPFVIMSDLKKEPAGVGKGVAAKDFEDGDLELISDLVFYAGEHGFNYTAFVVRKTHCTSKCVFLQTVRVDLSQDAPELFLQHALDLDLGQGNYCQNYLGGPVKTCETTPNRELMRVCGWEWDAQDQCGSEEEAVFYRPYELQVDLEQTSRVTQVAFELEDPYTFSRDIPGKDENFDLEVWVGEANRFDDSKDTQCELDTDVRKEFNGYNCTKETGCVLVDRESIRHVKYACSTDVQGRFVFIRSTENYHAKVSDQGEDYCNVGVSESDPEEGLDLMSKMMDEAQCEKACGDRTDREDLHNKLEFELVEDENVQNGSWVFRL